MLVPPSPSTSRRAGLVGQVAVGQHGQTRRLLFRDDPGEKSAKYVTEPAPRQRRTTAAMANCCALAQPFTTHHNALDSDPHLRIATELYLKRCVIGASSGSMKLGKDFRNEGVSPKHSPSSRWSSERGLRRLHRCRRAARAAGRARRRARPGYDQGPAQRDGDDRRPAHMPVMC